MLALTTGAGWLMVQSGLFKNTLERRKHTRICPACGRYQSDCGCR